MLQRQPPQTASAESLTTPPAGTSPASAARALHWLACTLTASATCCMVPEMLARKSGCSASAAPIRSKAAPRASVSLLCAGCSRTGAQESWLAGFCAQTHTRKRGRAMANVEANFRVHRWGLPSCLRQRGAHQGVMGS